MKYKYYEVVYQNPRDKTINHRIYRIGNHPRYCYLQIYIAHTDSFNATQNTLGLLQHNNNVRSIKQISLEDIEESLSKQRLRCI